MEVSSNNASLSFVDTRTRETSRVTENISLWVVAGGGGVGEIPNPHLMVLSTHSYTCGYKSTCVHVVWSYI